MAGTMWHFRRKHTSFQGTQSKHLLQDSKLEACCCGKQAFVWPQIATRPYHVPIGEAQIPGASRSQRLSVTVITDAHQGGVHDVLGVAAPLSAGRCRGRGPWDAASWLPLRGRITEQRLSSLFCLNLPSSAASLLGQLSTYLESHAPSPLSSFYKGKKKERKETDVISNE